jgi:hypothetical protein
LVDLYEILFMVVVLEEKKVEKHSVKCQAMYRRELKP